MRMLTLLVFAALTAFLRGMWWGLAFLTAACAYALYAKARPKGRFWWTLVFGAFTAGGYQAWARGPAVGIEITADVLAVGLLSLTLTATVSATDVLTAAARIARPFTRLGVDPQVVGLAAGLMWVSIPRLELVFDECRDAARARGLQHNARARLVPVVVRAVGIAQRSGDALAARGLP